MPTDFLVREVLVPRTCTPSAASHTYYLLSKCGYTTMEATRVIAEEFDVASTAVTYGGLKDEDGVTDQLVGLPVGSTSHVTWEHVADDGRYLRLARHGYGLEPLKIGGLEGNAFRIVARNIDPSAAEQLSARKRNFCFLNYYDIQRFGVPGGPRRTQHVGAALLASRWDDALAELVGLAAPESPAAAAWTGSAQDYFRSLDPRTSSFYLAAYGSADWNAHLMAIVREVSGGSAVDLEVDGVPFAYLENIDRVREVLAGSPDLPYQRYNFEPDGISSRESSRPTVIQTQMAFGTAEPDEFFPGRCRVEIRFFLPSGCYATAAVRQLFRSDALAAVTRGTDPLA
ncbi:tRNA pseudouridine(13) synthase TruD [Kribbella sp. NPDC051718]|uniref:tRNA pseudouridine(13) synthase TruD n=1 Tax=Kribbella sp. NPDC051718 TaxID=3155168 RepID=UPI00342DC9BE